MSEQDRQKKFENDDDTAAEDVEAHVKDGHRHANEEDGGDDVEAHVKDHHR
ncbi:MAG: hypothetical protein ACJ76I_16215 [Gaiellaceae bacterium]